MFDNPSRLVMYLRVVPNSRVSDGSARLVRVAASVANATATDILARIASDTATGANRRIYNCAACRGINAPGNIMNRNDGEGLRQKSE